MTAKTPEEKAAFAAKMKKAKDEKKAEQSRAAPVVGEVVIEKKPKPSKVAAPKKAPKESTAPEGEADDNDDESVFL